MPLLKLFESGSIYLQENISIWLLLLLLVGGGAKEEQQRLNLSGPLCRPSIRPITIFYRFFFVLFNSKFGYGSAKCFLYARFETFFQNQE